MGSAPENRGRLGSFIIPWAPLGPSYQSSCEDCRVSVLGFTDGVDPCLSTLTFLTCSFKWSNRLGICSLYSCCSFLNTFCTDSNSSCLTLASSLKTCCSDSSTLWCSLASSLINWCSCSSSLCLSWASSPACTILRRLFLLGRRQIMSMGCHSHEASPCINALNTSTIGTSSPKSIIVSHSFITNNPSGCTPAVLWIIWETRLSVYLPIGNGFPLLCKAFNNNERVGWWIDSWLWKFSSPHKPNADSVLWAMSANV